MPCSFCAIRGKVCGIEEKVFRNPEIGNQDYLQVLKSNPEAGPEITPTLSSHEPKSVTLNFKSGASILPL
jgi:hypothetical protein